jgi:hypothetical protein
MSSLGQLRRVTPSLVDAANALLSESQNVLIGARRVEQDCGLLGMREVELAERLEGGPLTEPWEVNSNCSMALPAGNRESAYGLRRRAERRFAEVEPLSDQLVLGAAAAAPRPGRGGTRSSSARDRGGRRRSCRGSDRAEPPLCAVCDQSLPNRDALPSNKPNRNVIPRSSAASRNCVNLNQPDGTPLCDSLAQRRQPSDWSSEPPMLLLPDIVGSASGVGRRRVAKAHSST